MARVKYNGKEEGGGNDQSAHLAHCWLLESDEASWHKCRRACHRDLQFGKNSDRALQGENFGDP
jgi:hypothetical protein